MLQMNRIFIALVLFASFIACNSKKMKYDASGTFEVTEVIVSSEVQGKILRLDLEEGDQLKIGELVGIIDSIQLYLQKLQLVASNSSVRSKETDISTQISSLKVQIKKQMQEKERFETLFKNGAATRKQVDDLTSQLHVLQKELDAKISILKKGNESINEESDAISIQIARIEDQLAKCRIIVPVNGFVLSKYAQTGELANIGTPLFKLGDISRPFLRAYVTSEQLKAVRLGQSVAVYADYGGGQMKEYNGRVSYIGNKAEFTPKGILTDNERANLVYPVKIALQNDGEIKIGMYGHVKF